MSVGNILVRLRDVKNLSQEALSQELGISSSYLSLIENGKRPLTRRVLRTLAKYFRMPAGYIVLENIDVQDLSERHREIVKQVREELVEPALHRLFSGSGNHSGQDHSTEAD